MLRNVNYRDYLMALAAGVEYQIDVVGDYWQVIEATGPVDFAFDQGVRIRRYTSMGGPAQYRTVTISSPTAQTVRVALGNTDGRVPYDGRASLTGFSVTATPEIINTVSTVGADVSIPAGGSAVISAASVAKRQTRVEVPPDAAGLIRVGSASVSATIGGRFYPGTVEYIDGSMALSAFNPNGLPVVVSVMELAKV